MPKDLADKIIMFSVIGLVAWAIIGLPVFNSLQQAEPNYQSQPAKAETQHGETSNARPEPNAQKHNHEGSQKGAWYDTFLNHMPDWFVAIFTALLTVVTFLLVRSTNRLWEAGERQLKTSRSVAAVQARNTRRQLKISEETAERQLRAYLTPTIAELRGLTAGGEIQCHVVLKNTGQTPAFNVTTLYSFGFEVYDENLPLPAEPSDVPRASRSTVGAGSESHLTQFLAGGFTQERADLLHNRTYIFRATGVVRYIDAFGKARVTRFHYLYGGPDMVLNDKGVMRHAHHGEEAT